MIVYTGDIAILNQLDKVDINGWRIEIITDGANVPFINEETINNPVFAELHMQFEQLTPTEYTPHGNQ